MNFKSLFKLVTAGVAIALAVSLIVFLIQYFFKDPVTSLIIELFTTSIFLLCKFLIYVFIIGGILMVLLVHWVGWENIKFKMKQMHYRSALMAKDYYKEYKRVRYEKFMGAFTRFQRKMLEGDESLVGERLAGDQDTVQAERKGSEVTYKDGKLWGIVRNYYENGDLESEISYEDGQYHGWYRTYYPDGRIHNEKSYKNGKLDGVFKAWDEDGSLFFEVNYKDNRQHGPDKIYYRHGIMQYEDMYVDGKRTVRKTFDESGKLKFIQNYH